MDRFIIIRHAETAANAEGRWHGEADEMISDLGRKETRSAGRRLRSVVSEWGCDRVICSDLQRACETASILADLLGVRHVIKEPLLRERDMGEWLGRAPTEVETLWPGALSAWAAGVLPGPPGGETDAEVAARAKRAILSRASCTGSGVQLVVTHGGVIRSLRRDFGFENLPVPHLGGHWAEISTSGVLQLGKEIVIGSPHARPLT